MAKKQKIESKSPADSVLKIPVTLADFKFKKMSGSWEISFELQPENLERGKPLMDCMGDHFVLVLMRVENKDAMSDALERELLGGLE